MLHCCGPKLFADAGHILFADIPIIVEDTDFDQFMAVKAGADLLHDGFGKPVLADGNNWVESVGTGTQLTSLVGSYVKHSITLCKGRILPGLGNETNQNE